MAAIDSLMAELDERTIAWRVCRPHDEARGRYYLMFNNVGTWNEFREIIVDYYTKHCVACFIHSADLPDSMAYCGATDLIAREYRRRGGDIVTAYNDAHDGTNGGLRAVLDTIAEGLKADAVEAYVRNVFDKYVEPDSWEQRVEIVRQFMVRYGDYLDSSIRTDKPERYANNYKELISAFVAGMQKTSSIFRRL
jgi:hypothetical protein